MTKTCETCSVEFEAVRNSKYCGQKCRSRAMYLQSRGKSTVPVGVSLQCPGCGENFTKVATTQKFCANDECKKERAKRRWRKWYDKGQRDKINEYQQRYRLETSYHTLWRIEQLYGLSWEEYATLLDQFNRRCYICGSAEELCVDHCHETGDIRGILCRSCNKAIGQLGDSRESVLKAVEYLSLTPVYEGRAKGDARSKTN